MQNSTVWLWVLCLLSGCLPGKEALSEADADLSVLGFQVRDLNHGVWPPGGIARAPRFLLDLEGRLEGLDRRVFLVDGALDPELEADLLDPPLREASERRLVPITIEADGAAVTVAPGLRLLPEQQLTLLVIETRETLWSQVLTVSGAPSAGARLVETLPATQARNVATNLKSVWLRFDGFLAPVQPSASAEIGGSSSSLAHRVFPCAELALPEGDCLELTPATQLPPHQSVTLRVAGLVDSTGAPLEDTTITFETGDALDQTLPQSVERTCALDERFVPGVGCLLEQDTSLTLNLTVDEPVVATLQTEHQVRSVFSFGANVELSLRDLEPGLNMPATLRLTDLAGQVRALPLLLATAADLPSLSIDEVRCDPLGPEPAQETIELLNFGGEPLEIQGFYVSDDAGERGVMITDALRIVPSERVLVVGPDFDPRDLADGMLSPGVRIARTDKALSLGNEGEALFLRDPMGRRVSAAPREKPAREGACLARISADPRASARGSFRSDPHGTCTPGAETIWP